jgi:hypothetical protein
VPAIPAILAPVASILAAIADVLAPVAAILAPIAASADVARIASILASIADVLAAIPPVFASIADVFDAIADRMAPRFVAGERRRGQDGQRREERGRNQQSDDACRSGHGRSLLSAAHGSDTDMTLPPAAGLKPGRGRAEAGRRAGGGWAEAGRRPGGCPARSTGELEPAGRGRRLRPDL